MSAPRLHAGLPANTLIALPVFGSVIGTALQASPWWSWSMFAATVVSGGAIARRARAIPAELRLSPKWRAGLVHIWCSECGRDLDWAPDEFAATHPAPLCWPCRQLVHAGQLQRSAVVGAVEEGVQR
jgi:hypothetical protein